MILTLLLFMEEPQLMIKLENLETVSMSLLQHQAD